MVPHQRPLKGRVDRSISPNPHRFAPSPLNESPLLSNKTQRSSYLNHGHNGDPIPRSTSVDLPSLGEEGQEYAGLAAELSASEQNSNPEQTATVAHDLKLHAPKPSLPASSAKQRVMTVTRTDSDRAASFGIGRPSSVDESTPALPSNRSLKKKASTTSQLSMDSHIEDEHGIPEIGQQVPMYPNAGDVQAPSPSPAIITTEGSKARHHQRKTSARGNLPPGSYGLHGHGVVSQDKLEKQYYEKHPDLLKKEYTPHHHDRPNDFSMSSEDLNRIVRDTKSRGAGLAVKNYPGTPTDQIGWQAIEESTSRVASPRPASTEVKSAHKPSVSDSEGEKEVIHVDEPSRRRSRVVFENGETPSVIEEEDRPYSAPILAEDELAKDPEAYDHEPAVEPHLEDEDSPSRPTSRPASLYKESSFEVRSTPLEDVEEYEPLFEDEEDKPKTTEEKIKAEHKRRFPSADIWEDAPSSVYYTAEVSTPEPSEEQTRFAHQVVPPPRDGETPAQAFARHQEELAEKEARENGPDGFVPTRNKSKPIWVQKQLGEEIKAEVPSSRPSMANRFPSRDVWEDTPESLQLETTVSTPQQQQENEPLSPVDAASKPEIPQRKPAIPGRPKPKQLSGDDVKPVVSDKPKPQIPARPVKAGPTSGGAGPAEAAAPPKQKPAVPARPGVGSKIAALQAGFMADLNNRLKLGPQAPLKKEEPATEEQVEEKEKAPLVDARKGRARGPQRRAPAAKSASPAPLPEETESKAAAPTFGFSTAMTFFEIDPEDESVSVGHSQQEEKKQEPVQAEGTKTPKEVESSSIDKTVVEPEPKKDEAEQVTEEDKQEEKPKEEEQKVEEVKTLATNAQGETVVEGQVEKDKNDGSVEPIQVEETGLEN